MGLLDLSTSSSSKKHVDFNDARYQLADKLKWNGKQSVRSTFTLYDNKEGDKVAVQDISAAYALSDKKLPMGELLNKMVDLITDMEDGVLDTEKDAVYTWKYSMALISMYEDKVKRSESLTVFDNGLKTSVINSQTFRERYKGKYTNRTNFFDPKVKTGMMQDIVDTFSKDALLKIHETAIKQSRETAERHSNPILDRIVQWAVENYKCDVDSFYDIKEDQNTKLFYSINTIILHLRNGYDMSIIGYAGTEYDDKFAISVLDAHNISITQHAERIDQNKIKNTLTEASDKENIDPLTKLLRLEKNKNEVLRQQYDILMEIRPMVSADVLSLKAAESVVGENYIWGCNQFRQTHADLPQDFKLEDVVLPQFEESNLSQAELERQKHFVESVDEIANNMIVKQVAASDVEQTAKTMLNSPEPEKKEPEAPVLVNVNIEMDQPEQIDDVQEIDDEQTTNSENVPEIADNTPMPVEDLFSDLPSTKRVETEAKQFGAQKEFQMPTLTLGSTTPQQVGVPKEQKKDFDPGATLLPGFTPPKPVEEEFEGPSATGNAQPMPTIETTLLPSIDMGMPESKKEPENAEKKEQPAAPQKPKLLFDNSDDIDSLFD